MIKTTLLTQENDCYKTYEHNIIQNITGKFIKPEIRKKMIPELMTKTRRNKMFWFVNGDVELQHPNEIYCIDHVPYNTDLILPKNPLPADWVVLYYEQTTMTVNVSKDAVTKINIRGNRERIMGLDESLVCDIAFSALRFTYLDKQNGWVLT